MCEIFLLFLFSMWKNIRKKELKNNWPACWDSKWRNFRVLAFWVSFFLSKYFETWTKQMNFHFLFDVNYCEIQCKNSNAFVLLLTLKSYFCLFLKFSLSQIAFKAIFAWEKCSRIRKLFCFCLCTLKFHSVKQTKTESDKRFCFLNSKYFRTFSIFEKT